MTPSWNKWNVISGVKVLILLYKKKKTNKQYFLCFNYFKKNHIQQLVYILGCLMGNFSPLPKTMHSIDSVGSMYDLCNKHKSVPQMLHLFQSLTSWFLIIKSAKTDTYKSNTDQYSPWSFLFYQARCLMEQDQIIYYIYKYIIYFFLVCTRSVLFVVAEL